jgi:hypothetical protein
VANAEKLPFEAGEELVRADANLSYCWRPAA